MIASTIVVVLISSMRTYRHDTLVGFIFIALYIGNWAWATHYSSLGILTQTWSLGLEEQFYLVWPLVFVVLAARRRRELVATILAGLAIADVIYRIALLHAGISAVRVYAGTDSHCDGLLWGCSLAFWLASGQLNRLLIKRVLMIVTPLAIAGLVALILWVPWGVNATSVAYLAPAALFAAIVLANQVTSPLPLVTPILRSTAAVWIGKRSYGLYLWHFPIYLLIERVYTRIMVREVST